MALKKYKVSRWGKSTALRHYEVNTVLKINVAFYSSLDQCELEIFALDTHTLLYVESISVWSNQGSVMCLLSILNQ